MNDITGNAHLETEYDDHQTLVLTQAAGVDTSHFAQAAGTVEQLFTNLASSICTGPLAEAHGESCVRYLIDTVVPTLDHARDTTDSALASAPASMGSNSAHQTYLTEVMRAQMVRDSGVAKQLMACDAGSL